jgi:hypothetical protein
MKNNKIERRKTVSRLLKNVALIALLGCAGFNLPLSYGQQVSRQKITSAHQVTTVHMTYKPEKVSEMELKTISEALPVRSGTSPKSLNRTQPSAFQPIEVISPENNQKWEAGNEYTISWSGAKNEVRIDLIFSGGGVRPTAKYSIATRAPNTGTYRFKVPFNWVKDSEGYKVVIETIDGNQSGSSQGTINVYTQPVDLECRIVDSKLKRKSNYYVAYIENKRWLEFNVLMRNKGIQSPVTIQNVLVRIIKEPEGVVVAQEEWGFSGIYHHDWYKLPDPRKFNISSLEAYPFYAEENINFNNGTYRVEVELDPQNRLGEIQELRYDNKDWQPWKIR